MRNADQQYHDLMKRVLEEGHEKTDRTGTGTLSITGAMMKFDLQKEFPLITTKRVFWKGVVAELIMFLRGYDNEKWLQEQGVGIWDEWPAGEKYIPYGRMWRNVPKLEIVENKYSGFQPDMFDGSGLLTNVDVIVHHVDQLKNAIDLLKTDPDSRRILVNCWQVAHMDEFVLAPCHNQFQFTTHVKEGERYLNCVVYQRSCDVFLGLPFNIASYALLTDIVALECDMEVGELTWMGGDVHLYKNHLEQVKEQLSRTSKSEPSLYSYDYRSLEEYEISDFQLYDYDPHPAIKAPVAI